MLGPEVDAERLVRHEVGIESQQRPWRSLIRFGAPAGHVGVTCVVVEGEGHAVRCLLRDAERCDPQKQAAMAEIGARHYKSIQAVDLRTADVACEAIVSQIAVSRARASSVY